MRVLHGLIRTLGPGGWSAPPPGLPPFSRIIRLKAGQAKAEVIADGQALKNGPAFPAGEAIPDVYPELDTDLARDNVENDIPAADLEDL